ncbi:MAG TPA: hypothetical protein VK034_26840 [Enhygromyxa sp.]|nr:hypothetical protein [Enhygromyxa sp.]
MTGRWICAALTVITMTASPAAAEPPAPAEPVTVDPSNYKLVLAGDIVIGFGGAGLVTMLVGLGIRSDALGRRQALLSSIEPNPDAIAREDRRIETGTILAITGGAAAGALFATGITLVALGYSRERKRREALRMVATPTLGRDRLGLSFTLRF